MPSLPVALHCTFPEPNFYMFCNIRGFAYLHDFEPWVTERKVY